jgi:hypothetical protein
MRRIGWTAIAVVMVGILASSPRIFGSHDERGDDGGRGRRQCNEATIRGNYGIQIQGTRPAPGGVIESVIGVVLRHYDGAGGITQVDNVKGSVTGIVPDRFGTGTYEVSADCTGIARFSPGPGILLEERIVIVDDGREIRSMVAAPLGVMVTGVHQRIHNQ